MSRLELLATIPLADEPSFALLLEKLSDLPQLLQQRELDLLPPVMLVTDLLRTLRAQHQSDVRLSVLLERRPVKLRAPGQLLLHVAPGESQESSGWLEQLPGHLQDLLAQHRPSDDSSFAGQGCGAVVAAPLSRLPDAERLERVIASLNQPTREQLMADLELQRQKAKDVLHKIFPGPVVQQLEEGASTIYDYYPATTILFSDMVGFTTMSKTMDARELVTFIDDIFQRIDRLCLQHGVEKIKTIGDAYMAAAGVPTACNDHAERIARLALDIQSLHRDLRVHDGCQTLNVRIGIHSGPVVAGVIGLNKYSFDLWGDTVNVASRLESSGIPGEIQISSATRALLPRQWIAESRGQVALKGHSSVDTFLLRGR